MLSSLHYSGANTHSTSRLALPEPLVPLRSPPILSVAHYWITITGSPTFHGLGPRT